MFRNVKKQNCPFSDSSRIWGYIHNSHLSFPEQENDIVKETENIGRLKNCFYQFDEVYFGK